MRSSSGQHFAALDHVRALAAFLVFCWHFLHSSTGTPVPFEGAPAVLPLAIVDEGHTGVALFMVLSGYLFAKLLAGQRISYPHFLWNRLVRLGPLLLLIFMIRIVEAQVSGQGLSDIARRLYSGFLLPTWPNGGWSVTAELHFYLLLPLLLYLSCRHRSLPLAVVATALVLRCCIYLGTGEVQILSYGTIVGRIDQFTLGIVAFHHAADIKRHSKWVCCIVAAFLLFYWWFDLAGGFFGNAGYPSRSAVWIYLPTLEGIAYGSLIAWYDQSPRLQAFPGSGLIQKLGEYSYSIYLFHFFVVFELARIVHTHVMDISGIYRATAWAAIFFVAMVIPGHLSYRYLEKPFLRFRSNYIRPMAEVPAHPAPAVTAAR